MKTFKNFIIENNSIAAISEPIHFKNRTKIKSNSFIPLPIHFKHIGSNSSLSEDNDSSFEAAKNEPESIHNAMRKVGGLGSDKNDSIKITKLLHQHQKNNKRSPSFIERHRLKKYTSGGYSGNMSSNINRKMIENHKNGLNPTSGFTSDESKVHSTISKLANHPIGHEHSVFSGLGFDPRKVVDKKNNTLYSPAHISTSHHPGTARKFANMHRDDYEKGNEAHLMHIRLKPTDKAYHVGKYSKESSEHETIIPAGTTLRYLGSTYHKDPDEGDPDGPGVPWHLHHFEIAHHKGDN
ncbi:MAG: hypothetical protein EB127_16575 [Alphaproteobacteria bacterium]|nr:hypothetical protein [Alphaproteobacteria bacterium]